MKDLFLPYELAVRAKEKGFNDLCFALVTEKNSLFYLDISDKKELVFDQKVEMYNGSPCVPAPLYQQIVDWFRIKKAISVEISWNEHMKMWQGVIQDFRDPVNTYDDYGTSEDYYTTYNAVITEAFKLIP
jgi:hypothetical protein